MQRSMHNFWQLRFGKLDGIVRFSSPDAAGLKGTQGNDRHEGTHRRCPYVGAAGLARGFSWLSAARPKRRQPAHIVVRCLGGDFALIHSFRAVALQEADVVAPATRGRKRRGQIQVAGHDAVAGANQGRVRARIEAKPSMPKTGS